MKLETSGRLRIVANFKTFLMPVGERTLVLVEGMMEAREIESLERERLSRMKKRGSQRLRTVFRVGRAAVRRRL